MDPKQIGPLSAVAKSQVNQGAGFKLLGQVTPQPKYDLGLGSSVFENLAKNLISKQVTVPLGVGADLSRKLALMTGVDKVASAARAQVITDFAQMASRMKIPTASDLLGPVITQQMESISRMMETVNRVNWAARSYASIAVTPVRARAQVRALLGRLHPALLQKFDGMYEALGGTDGIGQSAYSATELIKLLTFTLVSYEEAALFARQTYNAKHSKLVHLELISIRYSLDFELMMMLTRQGNLGDEFQYIKHHVHEMPADVARDMLLELIDDLELYLVMLAQIIL